MSFLTILYLLSMKYRTNTYEPMFILASILFFSWGLLVTQRYYANGLLLVESCSVCPWEYSLRLIL